MEERGRQAISDALRNIFATAENFGVSGASLDALNAKLCDISQLLLGEEIPLAENGQEYFDRLDRQKEIRAGREPIDSDSYRQSLKNMIAQGANRVDCAVKSGETSQEIENYLVRIPEHYRDLARAFCVNFGRPPLKSEDALWRRGWMDQRQIGITPELVYEAFRRMQDRRLSMKSPQSVSAVAEEIKRERNAKPSANKKTVYRSKE